jgi:hypothetical protein
VFFQFLSVFITFLITCSKTVLEKSANKASCSRELWTYVSILHTLIWARIVAWVYQRQL